jgi:hypothetical protein
MGLTQKNAWAPLAPAQPVRWGERLVSKDVRHPASQSVHDLLKRINGNVLLHHFDPLERRSRQTYFARKLCERLLAAFFLEKFREFFSELVTHLDSVRLPSSHIWEKGLYFRMSVPDHYNEDREFDGTRNLR